MTMFAPARAKGAFDQDLLDSLVGLGHVVADQDAFAERQAVRFDGATASKRSRKAGRGGGIREGAGARGRDAMFLHEPLGEDFGRLKLGGLLARAPDAPPILLPQIYNTERERVVRPDDGEVGALFLGEGAEPGQIFRTQA